MRERFVARHEAGAEHRSGGARAQNSSYGRSGAYASCCDPGHGTSLDNHLGQHLTERLSGLDMTTGFHSLANQKVSAAVKRSFGAVSRRHLNAEFRAMRADYRYISVRQTPRKRDYGC